MNGKKQEFISFPAVSVHHQKLITEKESIEEEGSKSHQEEGWVVCRVFKKKVAAMRIVNEQDTSNCWYTEPQIEMPSYQQHYHNLIACKPELEMSYHLPHDSFLHLPQLESPKFPAYSSNSSQEHPNKHLHQVITASINPEKADDLSAMEQVADWRILDKFVVNQLSQYGDICKDFNCLDSTTDHVQVSDKYEAAGDYASTSSSFELWK
ncbi:vascular related NAC-domain protein 3 [Canna indica]|uniref:Vascular related NAC-domain protein 3 n=1 Tax=Canna indica TaxID=4628 RepID=A0AAQ3KP93_9LILI|nr:vascular related NAC-domain protein 3 [Canna indica]